MHILGKHLLIELVDCNMSILQDSEKVREIMIEAADKAGATIIGDKFHEFSPFGVSGVVIISESHLAIHTWPEYSYAAVDVFSCGEKINPKIAYDYVVEKFESKRPSYVEMKRGVMMNSYEKQKFLPVEGKVIAYDKQRELEMVSGIIET